MKILTHTEFNRICTLLWGEHFTPAASIALKKCTRTIERYRAGEANVPSPVRSRLVEAASAQGKLLAEVVASYRA